MFRRNELDCEAFTT